MKFSFLDILLLITCSLSLMFAFIEGNFTAGCGWITAIMMSLTYIFTKNTNNEIR